MYTTPKQTLHGDEIVHPQVYTTLLKNNMWKINTWSGFQLPPGPPLSNLKEVIYE